VVRASWEEERMKKRRFEARPTLGRSIVLAPVVGGEKTIECLVPIGGGGKDRRATGKEEADGGMLRVVWGGGCYQQNAVLLKLYPLE